MAKNVVKKITNTVSKTSKKVNLTYLLASVIFIGLIITLLVIVMRNKEGFKKFVAFDSMWVSKGEKGVDGAKGEDAKFEKSFIDENGNPVTEVFNNDQISTEFKNMLMDDMVEDGIIVKEEGEEGDIYYPTGTIYHKTYHNDKKNNIEPEVISSQRVIRRMWEFGYNKTTEFQGKYFKVNYTKKSKNSYVKITYTINLTGRNDYGNQFRIFSENSDNPGQISETHSMAGVWEPNWTNQIPKSVTITGIDTDKTKLEKTYFVKIGRFEDKFFAPTGNNNYGNIDINGQLSQEGHKYKKAGYLSSSCTIEEIVLPKDTETTLSTFI